MLQASYMNTEDKSVTKQELSQWDWHISTHADLHSHATRFHKRCISSMTFTSVHLYGYVYMRVGVACTLADSSDFGLLGEQKYTNMGDSLTWTPMNRCAKFDTASFILSREICNRTNTHTHTNPQTNSNRYNLPISTCR